MKLVASKNAPIDLNDVPFSTLIEQNSDSVEVILIIRVFLEIHLIIMVIPMVILLTILIGTPLILRVILKNLSMLKRFSIL